MRIKATLNKYCPDLGAGIAVVALAMAAATVAAFEPGTERVCVPSADGQRFECSEVSSARGVVAEGRSVNELAAVEAAESPPAAETPPAPDTAASELDHGAPLASPRSASRLPPYLMQKPTTGARQLAAPAPAPPPAPESVQDTTVSKPMPPTAAEASSPNLPTTARAETAQPEIPSAEIGAKPASAPAVQPSPSNPPPAAAQATGLPSSVRDMLQDSRAFAALPGSHYTLVLTSVRHPARLEALIATMQASPGPLYLLKLAMPDGAWYSLCWSEFDNLDAARAARARLPTDAALTSGWPRRIGLLQAEIAQ